jgi:hypothetical protein
MACTCSEFDNIRPHHFFGFGNMQPGGAHRRKCNWKAMSTKLLVGDRQETKSIVALRMLFLVCVAVHCVLNVVHVDDVSFA